MPPLPKDPSTRRRRNKTPGARVLTFPTKTTAPPLPELELEDRDGNRLPLVWHDRTRSWWATAWASPMAAEWLDADVERLLMLALVVDRFWRTGDTALLSEIRLTGALFGLSPIDRRRLSWEVERGEEAEERTAARRSSSPSKSSASSSSSKAPKDPRLALAQ